MLSSRYLLPFLICGPALFTLPGCKRAPTVGDHVLVDWENNTYPAMVIEAPSPTKFKVHYDGYDTV
jgi:hypothetical protein